MGRKLKRHDAETDEGPHQEETPQRSKEDPSVEERSGGLWTRETKISLAIMVLLLGGLGAAVYFRLSPESYGDDPFAFLRNDASEKAEPEEADTTEPSSPDAGELTPPPAAVVSSESTVMPAVNEVGADTYSNAEPYEQREPWQPPASSGPLVTGQPPTGPYPQDNGSFAQQAGSLAEQAAGAVVDQAQQVTDGFTQQAESLTQRTADALNRPLGQTSDSMVDQYQQAADGVREQVDSLSQQALEALPQDARQGLDALAEDARQSVDGFADQAGQAVDAFIQQAPQSLDSVIGQARDVIGEQMQRAEGFVQQAPDSVRDTIESAGSGATSFPTAATPAAQSPLSAFEPPRTATTPPPFQSSNPGGGAEPLVTIARPPSRLNPTSPLPNQPAAPAAPIEPQTPAPSYGRPPSQPLATMPSRRRPPDTFGQVPERFDASAFDPPATTQPPGLPRVQTAPPPVATTSPVPATQLPTTQMPVTQVPSTVQATGPLPTTLVPNAPAETGNFRRAEATYSVQTNDNYWLISKKLYGTGAYFKALFEHNRDRFPRANRLRVGDEIRTPSVEVLQQTYPKLSPRTAGVPASAGASTRGNLTPRGPLGGGRTYIVQAGDTLFDIARYELGEANRWHEIRQLNRDILGADANRLRAGIELRLPTDLASRPPSTISR